MDNYLFDDALKIIEKRHNNAITLADKKLDIALKNEEFKNTYFKRNHLNFQIAKNISINNKQDSNLIKERDTLEKHLLEIAKKNKINLNFEPVFTCKKCNDSGFCKDKICSCVKNIVNKELTSLTNVIPNKEDNFKNFNDNISPIYKDFKNTFINFTKNFSDKSKSFIISGESGTGKTFLINCIYNELIKKGFLVAYHTAFTFNNMCSKYHTTFTNDRYFYLNNLLSSDLLIIDDIGTEPLLTNITLEYLYVVLNERSIRNLPTIITTNLNLKQLQDRYTERTIARIVAKDKGYFLTLKGKSLRK